MEPIKFILHQDQVEALKQVFAEESNPNFTVINISEVLLNGLYEVEVYFESSIALWYVILRVGVRMRYNEQVKECLNNIDKELKKYGLE